MDEDEVDGDSWESFVENWSAKGSVCDFGQSRNRETKEERAKKSGERRRTFRVRLELGRDSLDLVVDVDQLNSPNDVASFFDIANRSEEAADLFYSSNQLCVKERG